MTEYLYSLSLAKQTRSFLFSLGIGFLLGLLYDVFRIFRVAFSKGKIGYFITDILYFIVFSFCTFLFLITVNEGQLRLYLIIGEVFGFLIYYFSVGVIVFRIFDRTISFIKRGFKKIKNIILSPIIRIKRRISKIFTKNVEKQRKKMEKVKNKSKFHLKVHMHLLYNLYVKKHNAVKDCDSNEREV